MEKKQGQKKIIGQKPEKRGQKGKENEEIHGDVVSHGWPIPSEEVVLTRLIFLTKVDRLKKFRSLM